MIQLKENAGISMSILTAMAVIAGFTVANCYYNQPLLELIRADLHVSEAQANLITVITQIATPSASSLSFRWATSIRAAASSWSICSWPP